jgi:hypothetical protein
LVKVNSTYPEVVTRLKALAFETNNALYYSVRQLGDIKNYSTESEINSPVKTVKKTINDAVDQKWCYNLRGQRIAASLMYTMPKGIYFRRTVSGKTLKFVKI